MDVFPPAIRDYVNAAAASLDAPTGMVAVPLLGLVAGLIGNRLHLVLKNDYREWLTLYVAIVAPPGSLKTPAINRAKAALGILQDRARTRYLES